MSVSGRIAAIALAGFGLGAVHAGLFDDDEARKAILDLRQRIEAVRVESEQRLNTRLAEDSRKAGEDNAQLRRSLLDLQNQIEALRAELANQRGQNERLAKDVSEIQRRQKDADQGVEERLRKLEPVKVTLDGRDFMADPGEKRDYEDALALFRKGDFAAAQPAFVDFLKRFARGGFAPSAFFWLGNAQYATRDYKEAIVNFHELITLAPDHVRAPEAALSLANCQIELKDIKSARKTLGDLIKVYPQSEAAATAKERLSRLK
ncbi:MAG: hypothetical protein RIS34_1905 [Pseudomonadota bacterium]|jgi:tol-pal system protein YbgF